MPFGRDMPYGRDGLRPINPNLKKAVSLLTAFFPVYSNS
jgi:hypothetical protein